MQKRVEIERVAAPPAGRIAVRRMWHGVFSLSTARDLGNGG
jgi:hypothetical protein